MKITRLQLKKIILEEFNKLNEAPAQAGLVKDGPFIPWSLPGIVGCIGLKGTDEKPVLYFYRGEDCDIESSPKDTNHNEMTMDTPETKEIVADLKDNVQSAMEKHFEFFQPHIYLRRSKPEPKFDAKKGSSTCKGSEINQDGIHHVTQLLVNNLSTFNEDSFEKTKKWIDENIKDAGDIELSNINDKLASAICKDIHNNQLKDNMEIWGTLPPHAKVGSSPTENKPSMLKFTVKSGIVSYDGSGSPKIIPGLIYPNNEKYQKYQSRNKEFNWSAFTAEKFVNAIQLSIDKMDILKDPNFELDIYVIHGSTPYSDLNETKIMCRQLRQIIKEELLKTQGVSEGMSLHIRKNVGIDQNIFRPGSSAFFALFREARQLYNEGKYKITETERELLEDFDIGEFGVTESGEIVPIDYPMLYGEYDIDEATYKGKKVKLNEPKRSDGKAYVYVKTKKKDKKGRYKVKKVTFGSSMPDAMGDSDAHKKRRKSFGDRHNCADKKDKTKPGWWSCRATKFFGRSIPGWW